MPSTQTGLFPFFSQWAASVSSSASSPVVQRYHARHTLNVLCDSMRHRRRRVYILLPLATRFKYHRARKRQSSHPPTIRAHTYTILFACFWCYATAVCVVSLSPFFLCDLPMIKVPARRFFSFLYFSPAAAAVDFFSHHLIRANINEEVKYCTLLHLYQPRKFTRFEKYSLSAAPLACGERARAPKMQKNSNAF